MSDKVNPKILFHIMQNTMNGLEKQNKNQRLFCLLF